MFVTADTIGRKYVPPKDPARRTSTGCSSNGKKGIHGMILYAVIVSSKAVGSRIDTCI
jgi:hypothetical protein